MSHSCRHTSDDIVIVMVISHEKDIEGFKRVIL